MRGWTLVLTLALQSTACETGNVCEPYCDVFCTNAGDDPDLAQCADGSPPAGDVLKACIVMCVDHMDTAGAQEDHDACTDDFAEDTLGLFRDGYEC